MTNTEEQIVTVSVTPEESADWIVRSALPRFLDLLTLEDEAAYFYGLEPFAGYTKTGRYRGWQGAGKRLEAAEMAVTDIYRRLLSLRNRYSKDVPTTAETAARGVCVFARQAMLPSRLGWNAYRVIGTASQLAKNAAECAGDDFEEIDQAWRDSLNAVADRALLRPYI